MPLIQKGAHLYEEPFTYLHMKTTLVDNRVISIGSMNFDECSFFCNNEANF
jgi:phosphatidylserine/phosphatidylglycerophosphate/cardiolipin synthase-like enzyme